MNKKNEMISPNIQLQIQAVKSVLLKQKATVNATNINFEAFEDTLWFHSVRPLVYHFLAENENLNAPPELSRNLAAFVQNQTFVSLTYAHEIGRLLQLFTAKKLKVLPYKGILFIHELYGNKQLRELGDMDFLFHPTSAAEGMRILLAEGYKFDTIDKSFEELPNEKLIATVLGAKGQYEVSFCKGNNLHIDFHWDMYYGFLPFNIDFNVFFETAIEQNIYNSKCLIPSPEAAFWMLLLHHGGKENWTRIKHFSDLIAFLSRYQNQFDWEAVLQTAKVYKLHKQLIVGLRLLKKHFDYNLPQLLDDELINYKKTIFEEGLIEQFWNKSEHWATLFPRLRMERIFVNMQDTGFSKRTYLRDFYKSYVTPNPLEQPRLFVFPANYPTLNFISKVATYLICKFR